MKTLKYFLLLGFAQSLLANQIISIDNRRFDENRQPTSENTLNPNALPPQTATNEPRKRLPITKTELQNQPDLLLTLFVSALKNNDSTTVETLLPLYQTQTKTDPELIQWGKAILAAEKQHFGNAIAIYESLLNLHPESQAVRLQLGIAQFKYRQNKEAAEHFKVLAKENLPAPLAQTLQYYLSNLTKQDEWKFDINGNYLNESNVNNVPAKGTKAEGFRPSSEPESAKVSAIT